MLKVSYDSHKDQTNLKEAIDAMKVHPYTSICDSFSI